MGVTVVTSDATIQVNTSQRVVIPVGWDAQIAAYGRGYNYPQPTGQTTVFRTGDDADIEATIFTPIRVTNSLKVQNSLTNFLTLGNTNLFNNLSRFTDSVGGQDYDGTGGSLVDYVIDHYTGLGISRITHSVNSTWNTCIDDALSSSLLGFTDWFVPNLNQFKSLWNSSKVGDNLGQFEYAPMWPVTDGWVSTTKTLPTSTTATSGSTLVHACVNNQEQITNQLKAASIFERIQIRKHY